VESKADIIKRLGRSPDRSDAVVFGWNAGSMPDPEPEHEAGQLSG